MGEPPAVRLPTLSPGDGDAGSSGDASALPPPLACWNASLNTSANMLAARAPAKCARRFQAHKFNAAMLRHEATGRPSDGVLGPNPYRIEPTRALSPRCRPQAASRGAHRDQCRHSECQGGCGTIAAHGRTLANCHLLPPPDSRKLPTSVGSERLGGLVNG